jgi:hypothetical protein
VTDRLTKTSGLVIEHVKRARDALDNFETDSETPAGVLKHPPIQNAALKVAREELRKAIALIERTNWSSVHLS